MSRAGFRRSVGWVSWPINAGVISYALGWEISDEEWDTLLSVNLRGAFNVLRAVAPPMMEAGRGGSIVLTSSSAGLRGLTHMAHYTASKFGVVGLAQAFANELGPWGNTVPPTGVGADLSGHDADSFMGTVGGQQAAALFAKYPPLAGAPGINVLRDPTCHPKRRTAPFQWWGRGTFLKPCCGWPPTSHASSPGPSSGSTLDPTTGSDERDREVAATITAASRVPVSSRGRSAPGRAFSRGR